MPDLLLRLLDEMSGLRHVTQGVDAGIEADGPWQSPLAYPDPDHVSKSPARFTGVLNIDVVPSLPDDAVMLGTASAWGHPPAGVQVFDVISPGVPPGGCWWFVGDSPGPLGVLGRSGAPPVVGVWVEGWGLMVLVGLCGLPFPWVLAQRLRRNS